MSIIKSDFHVDHSRHAYNGKPLVAQCHERTVYWCKMLVAVGMFCATVATFEKKMEAKHQLNIPNCYDLSEKFISAIAKGPYILECHELSMICVIAMDDKSLLKT